MSNRMRVLACVLVAFAPVVRAQGDPAEPWGDRQIDERIRKHRTAAATVTVTDAEGNPLADTAVTVQQTRHMFLFGCNVFLLNWIEDPQLEAVYEQGFAGLFNFATLPFYWGNYERESGRLEAGRLRTMAAWCAARGIRTKGHPLCWHTVPPRWLLDAGVGEIQERQVGRIRREVAEFRGLIDTWDVVNEVLAMPDHEEGGSPLARLCRKLTIPGLVGTMFGEARRNNPDATLILNDFRSDEAFVQVLRRCLDAGVPVDAVGLQSHMHMGAWPDEQIWEVCERLGALGKPIHFTELTVLSGRPKTDTDWLGHHPGWHTTAEDEARQAGHVRRIYRLLFSHPAVEAVTWWDFTDRHAWQGAPAGLVRADMSPKPAYAVLRQLVRGDWWTGPRALTTDARGRVTFRGYLGTYRIQAGPNAATFTLDKPGEIDLRVTAAIPAYKWREQE